MSFENPKDWPLVSSREVATFSMFAVHELRATSPRTGAEMDFHVVHLPDLLLVVPLTEDGKLVMIRQYRHGNRKVGLEFPGGMLDAADPSPREGAIRELREETGYVGGEIWPLGELDPQPAFVANACQFFAAIGVQPTAIQDLDDGEDIAVELVDPGEADKLIAGGEINNVTSVAALTLARADQRFREMTGQ